MFHTFLSFFVFFSCHSPLTSPECDCPDSGPARSPSGAGKSLLYSTGSAELAPRIALFPFPNHNRTCEKEERRQWINPMRAIQSIFGSGHRFHWPCQQIQLPIVKHLFFLLLQTCFTSDSLSRWMANDEENGETDSLLRVYTCQHFGNPCLCPSQSNHQKVSHLICVAFNTDRQSSLCVHWRYVSDTTCSLNNVIYIRTYQLWTNHDAIVVCGGSVLLLFINHWHHHPRVELNSIICLRFIKGNWWNIK